MGALGPPFGFQNVRKCPLGLHEPRMGSFGSKSAPNGAPWPPQGSILITLGIIVGDFSYCLAHILVTSGRIYVTIWLQLLRLIFVPLGCCSYCSADVRTICLLPLACYSYCSADVRTVCLLFVPLGCYSYRSAEIRTVCLRFVLFGCPPRPLRLIL